MMTIVIVAALFLTALTSLAYGLIRLRHMQRWLGPYLFQRLRRRRPLTGAIHLILCLADHFEPKAYGADKEQGLARVKYWHEHYPALGRFRDSDGRPPRYSFFFPAEEYEPEYLDLLADLSRQGLAEVEIHLHHQDDTPHGFRSKLENFRDLLVHRHGLLARQRNTGAVKYGFIHGNWALCNAQPDGSCCGVDQEIAILQETGCYADLTFPSAPDPSQPPRVNSLYYANDLAGQRRSHEHGPEVGAGPQPADSLLMIQGPLMLDFQQRKWGLVPRLENGCLQATQPADIRRLNHWLQAAVQVPSRPDWYFVKLHAHGATEDMHEALLGEPMVRFHEQLQARRKADPNFYVHYVTAREMYNLVKAAEAGFMGPVTEARDWELVLASGGCKPPDS